VVWYTFADLSEECAVFIFRAEAVLFIPTTVGTMDLIHSEWFSGVPQLLFSECTAISLEAKQPELITHFHLLVMILRIYGS
jgi:putative effector of murein hydrolase LrgA (UPF0299 family)